MPLIVTVTVATAGLAAWVWSQRRDDAEDNLEHEPDLDYDNTDYGGNPSYGATRDNPASQQPEQPPRPQQSGETYGLAPEAAGSVGTGWSSRVSGALRRTPSPQQFLDSTGKTVAAGVAAAGAVVGKALASIREEDKSYTENNPWSEEADAKKERPPSSVSEKKRKTVAIVVSADAQLTGFEDDGSHEHAVRKGNRRHPQAF